MRVRLLALAVLAVVAGVLPRVSAGAGVHATALDEPVLDPFLA